MSQVTALSVLASVYLQSVVAAGGDDAESFLSPLASRSKVREVIRGLTATRQLSLIKMETHSLLYVEGSLPEFPEAEKAAPREPEPLAKPVVRRPHPTSPQEMEASLRRRVGGSVTRPAYKRPAASSEGFEKRISRPPQRTGGSFPPAAGTRPDSRKREGGYRPAAGSARPFKPRTSPEERTAPRSEPGTGLRPDGTPKKTRWRDLPGGRPDQKGKPKRFGPRKADGVSEGRSPRPAPRREAGSFRPAAGARPSGARPSDLRPSFDRRPTGGDRRSTGSDRGGPARPPFRPSGARPAGGGSRPPARSGAPRFGSGTAGARPFQRPRREDGPGSRRPPRPGASSGDRKFTPRPPKPGGFSSSRPRTGESRPYSPRLGRPSGPSSGVGGGARAGAVRPPSGRPTGAKPFNRTGSGPGSGFKPGGRSAGSSSKPGGRSAGGPPRTGSRPGFGQGPKPGGGRFSGGEGRPRPAPGRPPAKFKKRPESGE
jgi:23S rRNA pseudouridine2605 synthase